MQVSTKPQTVKISTASLFSMLGYQLVFYAVTFMLGYWIVTLNWKWLIFSAIVSLLQIPVQQKSAKYIKFVLDYLRPQEFFSVVRHYEQVIPDQQRSMFAYHPHSIFSYGVLCNSNNKNFPNQKLTNAIPLGSRFMLSLPIIGLHFRLWGLQSVDPKNLKRLMKKEKTISLVPGGYEQATITSTKQFRVYIKNRKGFIKYALKYGYTIRPVLITNQHKAMQTFDGFLKWRLLVNKIKMPGVIYWSKYGPLFPPGIRMHTIIGKGLKGTRTYLSNQQPNTEEINKLHEQYMQQIKRMYEAHKQKNGNTPLVFY